MKRINLALAVLALGPALAIAAAGTVEFSNTDPARFRDMKFSFNPTDREVQGILDNLREHLQRKGAQLLPADTKLQVLVTDVDLAGDLSPARGPREVRVVADVYPPRIDLEFKLLAADGKVLGEGKRELRDTSFLLKGRMGSSDALEHEKNMLTQWLREEFAARNLAQGK